MGDGSGCLELLFYSHAEIDFLCVWNHSAAQACPKLIQHFFLKSLFEQINDMIMCHKMLNHYVFKLDALLNV